MQNLVTIDDLEEYAFDGSGLSAHGCLEHLDDFAKEGIKRYERILLTKQKDRYIAGFQGCCYACEPVGLLNQELEKKIQRYENLEK